MATTSTIGLARAALVTALDTGQLADHVDYAWPGPELAKGAHERLWIDRVESWTQTIPNIKAGRKQRQETYVFELLLWVAKPEASVDGAQLTFKRALELLAVAESALADDVQLAELSVQWLALEDRTVELVPFERGWACQIVMQVQGNARLT